MNSLFFFCQHNALSTKLRILILSLSEAISTEMRQEVENEVIAFYDQIANAYDGNMTQEGSNEQIRKEVAKRFTALVPKGTVLDFGGGTGLDLPWLTEAGFSVCFCEPSSGMREQAKKMAQGLSSQTVLFWEDQKVNFETWSKRKPVEGGVEGILANFAVLNCIQELDLVMENLALILKPGGHLVALVLDDRKKRASFSYLLRLMKSKLGRTTLQTRARHQEHQHTAYVHSLKEIKRHSVPFFYLKSREFLGGYGFSLLHLVRR